MNANPEKFFEHFYCEPFICQMTGCQYFLTKWESLWKLPSGGPNKRRIDCERGLEQYAKD